MLLDLQVEISPILKVKFDNGYIVDALLYAPSPLGTISIDSKFPLENYQKMVNRTLKNKDLHMKNYLYRM